MMLLPMLMLAVQPPPIPYRAVGTEPGWSLLIGRKYLRLEWDYGRRKLLVPRPRAWVERDGFRYSGRGVTVRTVRRQCSDGMSDRVYPDTVTVAVGRRVLKGCGGL